MNTTIRTKFYTGFYCVFGTAVLGALWTSVKATEQSPPTKTVRFADLNIQTADGAKALYGRIRAAARDVCDRSVGGDPILSQARQSCVNKAIDDAVKKINAPQLNALRFGTTDLRLASK